MNTQRSPTLFIFKTEKIKIQNDNKLYTIYNTVLSELDELSSTSSLLLLVDVVFNSESTRSLAARVGTTVEFDRGLRALFDFFDFVDDFFCFFAVSRLELCDDEDLRCFKSLKEGLKSKRKKMIFYLKIKHFCYKKKKKQTFSKN